MKRAILVALSIVAASTSTVRATEKADEEQARELLRTFRSAQRDSEQYLSSGRALPPKVEDALRQTFTNLMAKAPSTFVEDCRKQLDRPALRRISALNQRLFEQKVEALCSATKYEDYISAITALVQFATDPKSEVANELMNDANQRNATLDLMQLRGAVDMYMIKHAKMPRTLDELVPKEMREIRNDPWGTPYRLTATATEFQLTSAGPDKKFDTSDDLINKESL